MKKNLLLLIFILVFVVHSFGQQKKLGVYSVAFYNVENLFDTERDETINDEEFTPEGSNAWTTDKYNKKLNNLASVISKLGREHCPVGPAAIGLAEIENRRVLEDLIQTGELASVDYEIVHYDSPDRRGVDVGLIYNPLLFQVLSSKPYKYIHPERENYRTRDQLLVSGLLAGEPVHIIVAHWPSRYGGKSSNMREVAAALTRHIVDSLYQAEVDPKIIFMGDLNDDPVDKSCRVVLDAKRKQTEVKPGGLYNTMWDFYSKGIGTLSYQGKWSLFDQIIISEPLLGKDRSTLKYWKAEIFNRDFLIQKEGKNKGYPLRTFSGNTFINGYSDHLPVLIYLVKEL